MRTLLVVLLASSALACADTARFVQVPPLTTAIPAETTSTPETPAPVVTTPSSEPTIPSADDQKRDLALAEKIAPFVDAFANVDPELSPDQKHVLFRSNRDGLWQLYLGDVAKPNAAPVKLTSGPERVGGGGFTPDGRFVVYTSDVGADESWRIFRMKADGTEATEISTQEKLQRGRPFVPRKKPDLVVFTARKPSEAQTRVYTMPLAGGAPQLVYTDDKPCFMTAVANDGKSALLVRRVSPSDAAVVRVPLEPNAVGTRVYPPEGKKAAVSDADFSADAKRIFVATDDGGEGSHLLALEASAKDAATWTVRARYDETSPTTASLDRMVVSPTGNLVAIGVDAGDHNAVRILNATTLKPQAPVKLPLGSATVGPFTDDGRAFTLFESTADMPADVFRVDAQSGAVKPLRDDKRDGLSTLAAVDVAIEKIPAHDALAIPVIKYLPKGASGKLPVIVSVHGGPPGSSRVGFSWMTRWFVAQGWAVIVPNVRGSTGFGRAFEQADNRDKRADAVRDLETVNKWIKAQPWSDPSRVVIYGGSWGGWSVLIALSRQPGAWAAGVDLFGPYDLKTLMRGTSGALRSIMIDELGDPDKDEQLLDAYSPKKDVDKIVAPLFVYAGANDPRVPRAESDAIVAALRARKVPVEYMVAANEGHSVDRRATKIELLARVTRFLGDRLKGSAPLAK